MCECDDDEGDGLNAFRGLMVACGFSVLFWVAVVAVVYAVRSAPDAPPERSRSAQASEAA